MAGTGTKRITELTEASAVQNGDYIAVDSNARGTKKVSTDTLATSAALTAETNARAGADEQMSERMDEIEEQTALIQNPTKTLSGALCSFTDGADMPMVACTAEIVPQQSGSGTPSPDNVRQISGWESVNVYVSPTEDEADGHTTTTSLGHTVYGGTLDVVSGVLTVDRAMDTFDGNSTFAIQGSGSDYVQFRTTATNPIMIKSPYGSWVTNADNFKCNALALSSSNPANSIRPANAVNPTAVYITMPSSIDTVDKMKEFATQTPIQYVYPLATPQTYTLTGQEISTLLGENNVWADSGDIEITYRRDISIVLENLENALNGSNSLNTMMMSAPTENTAEDEAEDDMR